MENLVIYLLKASALLTIFHLSYLLLLQKETSFYLNRKFLLGGLFISAILPAIYFTKKIYIQASASSFEFITTAPGNPALAAETPINWWYITGLVYLAVGGFFFCRLSYQLIAVLKLIFTGNFKKISGLRYLETRESQLPFSFFNYIVFNPDKHSAKDLQFILEHERIHAQQLHSMDILLANIAVCMLWFNPIAWLYKRSIEQNLEFIADRETIANKPQLKEYQHALVKASIADLKPALTNHFYQSFIKKRILMLNKKSSNQSPAWKLSLVLPLLLAFMLAFNVKTEAQVLTQQTETVPETSETSENEEEVEILEFIEETEAVVEDDSEELVEIEIEEAPEMSWSTKTPRRLKANGLSELGSEPLFIINGEKIKTSRLKNRYISLEGKMEILLGDAAVKHYGREAADGVIITPEADVIKNFNKELKELQDGNSFKKRYIMVDGTGKPSLINLNSNSDPARRMSFITHGAHDIHPAKKMIAWNAKAAPHPGKTYILKKTGEQATDQFHYEIKTNATNELKVISRDDKAVVSTSPKLKILTQTDKPIYFVDGKEQDPDFNLEDIAPEDIASVTVLKGDRAVEEHGKKARNGVIMINLKEVGRNTKRLFQLKNTFNDEQLQLLKEEVKSKTGYTLELTSIERNENGLITGIDVKLHQENRMVHSSYSNAEGVPTITFGIQENGGLLISSSN